MTEIINQVNAAYTNFNSQLENPNLETYCLGRQYWALSRAHLEVGGNVHNLPENPEQETVPKLAKLEIKLSLSNTPFFDQLVSWANEKIHR